MWKFAIAAAALLSCIEAQPAQGLLLPEAQHIVGMVVDPQGTPIAGAGIEHTGDLRQAYQTDSAGRFELDTRAPALVIRKAGYRSELIRTKDAGQVRVTLQKLDKEVFPACSGPGPFDGIDGWGASFQFPKIPGVVAGPQVKDADYGARTYYVETKPGPKGIMHGVGPLWSFGVPLEEDVWQSVSYEEVVFDNGGLPVIEARGQFASGARWRQLGKFGETAAYSGVDEATARILDRFLDGACLKPAPVK